MEACQPHKLNVVGSSPTSAPIQLGMLWMPNPEMPDDLMLHHQRARGFSRNRLLLISFRSMLFFMGIIWHRIYKETDTTNAVA